jgi:hypothetical protein
VSQEIKEKALDAAVRLGGNAKTVVEAAEAFAAFLGGATPPKGPSAKAATAATAVKETTTAKSAPTGKAPTNTSAASAKAVAKPVTKKDEINPDLKKMVGDKVNELLKADLRDQAVDLLASFEGATSATGIVKQGQEVVDAFLAGADELLASTTESIAD